MISNIYDAVFPILSTTALFGLSSIFVTTQNNQRNLKIFTRLKILNILYLTTFSFLIYMAISDLQNSEFQPDYVSGVTRIGFIFHLLADIILTYIIYIVNILRSPKILSSINDIKKIDEIFVDLGEKIDHRKHCFYEIGVIILGLIIILGRATVNILYVKNNVLTNSNDSHFVFFFPAFASFLLESYFLFLIFLLYQRFSLINKLLKNLRQEQLDQIYGRIKPSQEYSLKHPLKRIELLMEIHDSLIDVANKLNESFTIQLLSCLTAQFLTEVFTVFYVYYESMIIKNRTAALVWLIWSTSTAFEIIYLAIICHLTVQESKNTGIAIHKVLMNEHDTLIKRKLMIFSQQICHRPLHFTACGLFPIDATLIFTIAGAAATYLLIMLQFQEGLEAQCSNNTIN